MKFEAEISMPIFYFLFQESKIPTYQKMWAFMENKKPSVFTKETETGIERVKEGNYAYLMESTMLDYAIHRDCELMQVGGLLDSKGYGIGTPIGNGRCINMHRQFKLTIAPQ